MLTLLLTLDALDTMYFKVFFSTHFRICCS